VIGTSRWAPVLAVSVVAASFSWLNRGERVVVDVGIMTIYRAPLTVVVFVAFIAGMASMLLLGLRHDLRVRRELERRGIEPPPAAAPAPPPAAAPARTYLETPPAAAPAPLPEAPHAPPAPLPDREPPRPE
jgi:hypothetical protein